jgi:ATP-dependent RNA helicase DOB1
VKGKPNPLVSSFKLSYYTLLNLLRRVEGSGHDMEYVIRNSFQQFQFEQSLPEVRPVPYACSNAPGLWQRCKRVQPW